MSHPVETLGPDIYALVWIDQGNIDTDTLAGMAHGSAYQIAHPKVFGDIRKARLGTCKIAAGGVGNDGQVRNLGQVGRQILAEPVSEEL